MRYAVVIEKAPANYAALPGCIATGTTVQKLSLSSEKPSSFILKASRPTAFLFHRQAAKLNTSIFQPKSAAAHISPADGLRLNMVGRNVLRTDRQRGGASRSLSGRHEIVLIDNHPTFR